MITVGLLYESFTLIEYLNKYSLDSDRFLESFRKLGVTDGAAVLNLSTECRWVEQTASGKLVATTDGAAILNCEVPTERLKIQLKGILSRLQPRPSWAKKMGDGRSEALKVMPTEIRQIFEEAGLLETWDVHLEDWWLEAGLIARSKTSELNQITGARAERLTVAHEEKRTGVKPVRKSIDSSYAGYDVLSVVDKSDSRPLAIEVKGSVRPPREATFMLSEGEWQVGNGRDTYCVHLWHIRESGESSERDDFRVVWQSQLAEHIPENRGNGRWKSVEIPFSVFWRTQKQP